MHEEHPAWGAESEPIVAVGFGMQPLDHPAWSAVSEPSVTTTAVDSAAGSRVREPGWERRIRESLNESLEDGTAINV